MTTAPIFITATGTEIGKTYLSAQLLEAWRAGGLTVMASKPALSGFEDADTTSDAHQLLRASGEQTTSADIDSISPFRFTAPLAPDAAARAEGRTLFLKDLTGAVAKRLAATADVRLIEGAGGAMSPIAEDGLNVDLIEATGAHAVLVAGAYLGAITHTLTAIDALRGRNISIAAIVVNEFARAPQFVETTASDISQWAKGVTVLTLTDGSDARDIAAALATNSDQSPV